MIAGLIRRLVKGSPLTAAEHDGNLDAIEDAFDGIRAVPSGGTNGQVLKSDASGGLVWGNDNNTTYTVMSEVEGNTGTATTTRLLSPVRLKQQIQHHAIPSDGGITRVVSITQAAYDALPTKVATTLYVVNG